MNRRVLIGVLIAVVGVALIGLGILAINRVLQQSFAPPPQPTAVVEATTDVVLTTHDMAVGTVLQREDVTMATVPVSVAPRDVLQSIEDALGKIVTAHMIQGEMVMQHHLADPTNVSHDIGYVIGDDQVLMAFPAEDLMSGLGVLQRGDNVDIFATMTVAVSQTNPAEVVGGTQQQQPKPKLYTFDAFQRIQVTAMVVEVINQGNSSNNASADQAQPTPNPANIKVRAYLLALNTQDALVLKNMRDVGATFDIVLRSPTSTVMFDVSPVTEEYLVQRYKLTLPR